MLVFNWLLAVIVALFLQIPMLMDPMVMSVLYVWCQLNKDVIVNFWFGTQFKVRQKGSLTAYFLTNFPIHAFVKPGCSPKKRKFL